MNNSLIMTNSMENDTLQCPYEIKDDLRRNLDMKNIEVEIFSLRGELIQVLYH